MQTKLQHLTLLVNDKVGMVGFKKFQCMNETVCTIKGTGMGDWGNICVLAIGDLYQLPPVGQSPIYVSPQNINCLSDFASNGWDDMKLHELTQTMRQKDTYFIDCLIGIHTTVPKTGSKEDLMLKEHELKSYPQILVIQKKQCMCMLTTTTVIYGNEYMLESIPGDKFVNTTNNRKKDNLSNIADVVMPNKPSETGNLRKILEVKISTRIMITMNIDVSDGLTNGAMGLVTNIVTNQHTSNIEAILVKFDHETIGQDAKRRSMYKNINGNSIPILPLQVSFNVKRKDSFNATRTQFPMKLAWAVTIHKCQGLTLPEIVVDMSPSKGSFSPGQAYVAFSSLH